MRRYRRPGRLLPPAFAVLLTVAAGLSLAEEHVWQAGEAPAPTPPQARHPISSPVGHDISPVGHDAAATGVGSRALTGDEPSDRPAHRQP